MQRTSQLSVTPLPGDRVTAFGLYEHCMHIVHIHTCRQTLIEIKFKNDKEILKIDELTYVYSRFILFVESLAKEATDLTTTTLLYPFN